MSTKYTIIIKNASKSPSKIYNVFSQQPGVEGGGAQSTKSITWYKTKALPDGSQATFKYNDAFYGFLGYTSKLANEIATGDSVDTEATIKVKIGTIKNDGSVLFVAKSWALSENSDEKSAQNTFTISTESGIPYPDHYVVGIARGKESEGTLSPAPTDVVDLKAAVDYVFTPRQAVYIKASKYDEGTYQASIDQKSIDEKKVAKVEFSGAKSKATVTEDGSGNFSIKYD